MYIDDYQPKNTDMLNDWCESERIPIVIANRIERLFDGAYDLPEFYMELAKDSHLSVYLSPDMRHSRP